MRRVSAVVLAPALVGALLATPLPARADDAACIAASEQGLALRKQGKLHDAMKQLAACAEPSCPDEVKAECAKRIGDVQTSMPSLILAAKDGTGNDLVQVKVTMDGAPFATTLDGRSVSVDPGEHTFVFETTGQPAVEKKLVVREGERDRRESVVLGPVAPPPPPPGPPTPAPPPAPSFWTTQRTLAVVSAGVGVAGLAVGGIFGGLAMSDKNMQTSNCSAGSCPNRGQAQADYDTASQNATVSTIGFIAGGALLAAGAVLFFTAHDAEAPTTGRVYLAPSTTGSGPALVFGGAL